MDNTVKTLIIVVVILVAALGVVGGFFLNNYLANSVNNNPNHPTFNVTLNESNSSQQNSINSTTTSPSTQQSTTVNSSGDNNYPISESQALQIVTANAGNHPYVYAGTETMSGQTYYLFQYKIGQDNAGVGMYNSYMVNVETGAMS